MHNEDKVHTRHHVRAVLDKRYINLTIIVVIIITIKITIVLLIIITRHFLSLYYMYILLFDLI